MIVYAITDAIRKWTTVLARVSNDVMKHHDQKKLGKEWVYFAYGSLLLFIDGVSIPPGPATNKNRDLQ